MLTRSWQPRQPRDARRQVRAAAVDLGADRLVLRRQAFDGVGNAAVKQLETVVRRFRAVASSEPVLVQHPVQQDACMIARERPAGAVRSVHSWCETNDHQPGIHIAKGRHRFAVVTGIAFTNVIEKFRQPRALATVKIENRVSHSCAG